MYRQMDDFSPHKIPGKIDPTWKESGNGKWLTQQWMVRG